MRVPFNPKNEVTSLDEVFGRDILFSQLIAVANRKSSAQIVGSRRFGKTTLLKNLEAHLQSNQEAKVFPIYFDFKEVGSEVKGTANVYRYSIARLISCLTKDEIFTEPEIFRGQKITPSLIWEDIFIDLQEVNNIRVTGLFEDIATFFADLMEKTILFLIDEYEYLFRFSFDDPTGFMKFRNFTSKLTDKGLNPFTFFVAGSVTWEHLCSITGSGELNCIDQTIYVTPLTEEDFDKMWLYESSMIENCPDAIMSGSKFAYRASGGVAFYGKTIGSVWYTSGNKPDFLILKSHFQELFDSLENEQKHIIFEIASGRRIRNKSEGFFGLLEKGLIVSDGTSYSITVGFFADYIETLIANKASKQIPLSEEITNRIEDLIIRINSTHKNKRSSFIFKPVNEDATLFRDLRCECLSSDQFANFSSSIYHIVFERTKHNNTTKGTLPRDFKRNNQFIEIVDIMRHSLGRGHLMDNFNHRQGQMTKSRMLNILTGSKNEPSSPIEYCNLQVKVLELFEDELKKLNRMVLDM